jgi:hypothetical protein
LLYFKQNKPKLINIHFKCTDSLVASCLLSMYEGTLEHRLQWHRWIIAATSCFGTRDGSTTYRRRHFSPCRLRTKADYDVLYYI